MTEPSASHLLSIARIALHTILRLYPHEQRAPSKEFSQRREFPHPTGGIKVRVLAFVSHERAVSPPASADEMKRVLAGKSSRCARLP